MIDGKFPLRRWLGGSEHSAVFLTEFPRQTAQKAAIKFIAANDTEAERYLLRWRAAAQLSHPNLMRIFDAGRCKINGEPVLYLVMEYAEEDLSQILPHRPLVPGEATDMLPPLLDALSYLHSKGFIHGRIKPSNVLAVGDQLKLSADQVTSFAEVDSARRRRDVYDAPEVAAGIISPASDVWSIGITLIAALTQNISFAKESAGEASPGEPGPPESVPQPFRGIARECLHLDPKRRCSIAEIQARLQPAGRSVPAQSRAPANVRRPSKRAAIAAALLLAAVVVALVIYLSRGKGATAPPSSTTQQPAVQTTRAPKPNPAARQTGAASRKSAANGEVVRKVIPDVPQSAKNTITGTIKVGVRVEVNPSGKVISAKLKSAGPSKYFAGLALKAAQRWEFAVHEEDREPVASTWLLQFRFRRTSTDASSERTNR